MRRPKSARRRLAVAGLLWLVTLSVAAVALAAVAASHGRLPYLSDTPTSTRVDPDLSNAVVSLTGVGAVVHCWSHADWRRRVAELERRWPQLPELGSWAAFTWLYPAVQVDLSPELCLVLTRLRSGGLPVWDDPEPDALAWAVGTLAHEAVHAEGNTVESEASCFGMQRMAEAVVALGRTPEEGRYLARRYWERWYEHLEDSYRSADCADGGRLDLRPQDHAWP